MCIWSQVLYEQLRWGNQRKGRNRIFCGIHVVSESSDSESHGCRFCGSKAYKSHATLAFHGIFHSPEIRKSATVPYTISHTGLLLPKSLNSLRICYVFHETMIVLSPRGVKKENHQLGSRSTCTGNYRSWCRMESTMIIYNLGKKNSETSTAPDPLAEAEAQR